eukprot:6330-Heterococcus_DN1.PRE.1
MQCTINSVDKQQLSGQLSEEGTSFSSSNLLLTEKPAVCLATAHSLHSLQGAVREVTDVKSSAQ